MASNSVVINGGWRIYEVGDSKIGELTDWLEANGELQSAKPPVMEYEGDGITPEDPK